jgi:hypothetical protein
MGNPLMSWILIIGLLVVAIGGLILFILNGTIGMDAVTIGTIITALATAGSDQISGWCSLNSFKENDFP